MAQVRVGEHFTPGVYLEIRERVMEPVCAGAIRYASSGNTKQPLHGTDSGADGLASNEPYILYLYMINLGSFNFQVET